MISDETVEAAAKATFIHANLGSAWEDAQPDWQNAYRASVLAGLEAAAPYMMAPVLDLADQWQEDFPYKANQLREAITNPYRSQA